MSSRDDDDDDDDDADDDYNHQYGCFHLDMTMMIPPTPGKRHQDSISNRYRPATKSETLSYLNAWTQKQSVPPHTITWSDICPTPRPPPCSRCKAIFSLKPGGQFKWQPLVVGDNFEGRGWQDDAIAATAKPEAAKGSDYTMITLITGHRGHKDASCEHILNQMKLTPWKILS